MQHARSVLGATIALLAFASPAGAQWFGHVFAQGDLVHVDLSSGVASVVGNTGLTTAMGLAFNPVPVPGPSGTIPAGTLFGIGQTGDLHVIDTITAIPTLIGNTGIGDLPESLAFDLAGNLLAADSDLTPSMYSIDTATGLATLIGPINGMGDVDGLTVSPVALSVEGIGVLPAGTLFATDCGVPGNSELYVISPGALTATLVGILTSCETISFASDGTLYGNDLLGFLALVELDPLNELLFAPTPPNVAGGAIAPESDECFVQPPDFETGLISDLDCDLCLPQTTTEVVAESVLFGEAVSVGALGFVGAYIPGGVPLATDRFTVAFWSDDGGLPGTLLAKTGPIAATSRTATGTFFSGAPEFEYLIEIDNQPLNDGTVWVEIYNDTTECPWDCADADGMVGILDFLGLLGDWGEVGGPCDFDGNGVGISDFLALLGGWGPCPADLNDWLWSGAVTNPVQGAPGSAFSNARGTAEVWSQSVRDLTLRLHCRP